jgi:Glycosyl hydrolase family 45
MDNVKNGNETGVDCGGSCPACVPYVIGPPNTSTTVQNACTDGGDVSYICPRFMLFSGEMKQAAADDAAARGWPAGSFNYGVATLNGAACCSCYQIVYGAQQNTGYSYPSPKALVIQNFNTGGANDAFDVFMGKGGEGAQTNGCSKLYTSYPSIGEPNSGGIRASMISACGTDASSVASAACVSAVTGDCDQIEASSAYVTTTTQTSCIEANSAESLYHDNWDVRARQVECPAALTEVTGCKPNAGNNPQPDPTVQTAAEASSWGTYSTTTMEDCCKPSCAWPGNVSNTQAPWSAMYQCDGSGNPMHN